MKQLEDAQSATANKDFDATQMRRQREMPQLGRLLSPKLHLRSHETGKTGIGRETGAR